MMRGVLAVAARESSSDDPARTQGAQQSVSRLVAPRSSPVAGYRANPAERDRPGLACGRSHHYPTGPLPPSSLTSGDGLYRDGALQGRGLSPASGPAAAGSAASGFA